MAKKLDHPIPAATVTSPHAIYGRVAAPVVTSTTVDNGPGFAYHCRLADPIGVLTYLRDPYSAWQRGTNGHWNGRLQPYMPKKPQFDTSTQEDLDTWVNGINERPRKVLAWATPAEVFQQLRSSPQIPNSCTSS